MQRLVMFLLFHLSKVSLGYSWTLNQGFCWRWRDSFCKPAPFGKGFFCTKRRFFCDRF